jgi:hypothetical protein
MDAGGKMDWTQLKNQTVAMLTPDWEILKMTVWLIFIVCVPMVGLLYIFSQLFFS